MTRLDDADLAAGSIWSTAPRVGMDPAEVGPAQRRLPVRWNGIEASDRPVGTRGGVGEQVAAGQDHRQEISSDEPEPDAIARGWVVPPGGTRVDAIFVLAGTALGIGRVERVTPPVWLNLDDLVNLDAIGDPVDGLLQVEIVMEDQRAIGAGWTEDFCASVVEALRTTAGRPTATPGSPADTGLHTQVVAPAAADPFADPTRDAAPAPAPAPVAASPFAAPAPTAPPPASPFAAAPASTGISAPVPGPSDTRFAPAPPVDAPEPPAPAVAEAPPAPAADLTPPPPATTPAPVAAPPAAPVETPDLHAPVSPTALAGRGAGEQIMPFSPAESAVPAAPVAPSAPVAPAVPVAPVAAAMPSTPTVGGAPAASLELEDVVYLGGYPGQSKKRKKCVVGMSRTGLDLKGPGDLHFRVAWDDVRSIEVQNSDEARFRMNTKIHRDASALVVECDQGVTILLEARDCPTIALRSAISQLLAGLPVLVV